MSKNIYRKLAQRLDAIPNGFSPTESGAALRLLAKIFTPDEAALASVMRLTAEPAADIAARAGVKPDETYQILKKMSRQGLIRVKKREGQLVFGLMSFVVGTTKSSCLEWTWNWRPYLNSITRTRPPSTASSPLSSRSLSI